MKTKANRRMGNRYAEARELAYDLITNSNGIPSVEMAEMMVEQFGFSRIAMLNTLSQMARTNVIKVIGDRVIKGKKVPIYAGNRRKPPPALVVAEPVAAPAAPVTNGIGITVTVQTASGPVTLTVEQAKALVAGLGGLFK